MVVTTLELFQPSSGSKALTKAGRSFESPRFQLVAKASVMDVCFLTSGGGHLADVIAVASLDILALPVGAVVELVAGIVEAPLADAMVVLAAERVEVPLTGAVVVIVGTVSVVQDAAR